MKLAWPVSAGASFRFSSGGSTRRACIASPHSQTVITGHLPLQAQAARAPVALGSSPVAASQPNDHAPSAARPPCPACRLPPAP